MLGYLVQPVCKTAFSAPSLDLFQPVLHGFGLGFTGEGGKIGGKLFSFRVTDIQGHVLIIC